MQGVNEGSQRNTQVRYNKGSHYKWPQTPCILEPDHFILWELGLVIEFFPGSTILLLLAIVIHSNTSISKDETCYLFTQYAAGALF